MAAFKLREMQSICRATGQNFPKTKQEFVVEMRQRLKTHSSITNKYKSGEPIRVLSIDMGVRNLAYCLLEVNASHVYSAGVRQASTSEDLVRGLDNRPPQILQHARILRWKRLALQTAQSLDAEDENDTASEESSSEFKVPGFAVAASRLVLDTFIAMQPSHIVIERQRHRSGGHAAVLEWTFRVNMLEAMLWGSLSSIQKLAAKGQYQGQDPAAVANILMWPCPPSRMSAYWQHQAALAASKDASKESGAVPGLSGPLADSKDTQTYVEATSGAHKAAKTVSTKQRGKKEQNVKLERIFLAESWLSSALSVDEGANDMALSFRRGTYLKASAKPEKLKRDDLADCLLQGIAHLCWQANMTELSQQALFIAAVDARIPDLSTRLAKSPRTSKRKAVIGRQDADSIEE